MKQKNNDGKFYVKMESRYGNQFLRGKGRIEVGTPWESDYIYWAMDIRYAMRFRTVKQARAMCRIIESEHGIKTTVVTRDGKVI